MQILLIGQPNSNLSYDLTELLCSESYDVVMKDTVKQALDSDSNNVDLIIISESTACSAMDEDVKFLRRMRFEQPILCISKKRNPFSSASTLNAGADDVVVATIHSRELICRLLAILRRCARCALTTTQQIGNVCFDKSLGRLETTNQVLALPKKEHELLNCLVERVGVTVSRHYIMTRLYGHLDQPDSKILNVFACKLRKRLIEVSGGAVTITSVRDEGYALQYSPTEDVRMHQLTRAKKAA